MSGHRLYFDLKESAQPLELCLEIFPYLLDWSLSKCIEIEKEIGSKACGGPSGYIIYSSKNVDTDLLEEKVCYYTKFQEAVNIEYGLASDCALEAAPPVQLSNGSCTEANG